jgi:hypothetical protein
MLGSSSMWRSVCPAVFPSKKLASAEAITFDIHQGLPGSSRCLENVILLKEVFVFFALGVCEHVRGLSKVIMVVLKRIRLLT